jgi:hypothetical protein
MVSFQTKNPNWKMLVYFMNTWSIYGLLSFGTAIGNLVYFSPFWYFVPRKIWQPWLE